MSLRQRILQKLRPWVRRSRPQSILTHAPDLYGAIDESWSTDYALGMRGWVFHAQQPLERVEVRVGDRTIPITAWHDRPDVTAAYPHCPYTQNCGFWVQIPRQATHQITLQAHPAPETQSQTPIATTLTFAGSPPPSLAHDEQDPVIFNEFVNLVNQNQWRVLEIGSRIVSPGSRSKRELFPQAASYTGFDYYPDANTDVVGDAHRLSSYFEHQQFDAIFSISVFEHLAMPWLVAMEINRLLKMGGISFHATHFSWPLHEKPWDFWRFSDEGLKVLFSPPMGFQTLQAGFNEPLRMHFDDLVEGQEKFPRSAGFGGVSILSQKVADVDVQRFQWSADIADVVDGQSHYPDPDSRHSAARSHRQPPTDPEDS